MLFDAGLRRELTRSFAATLVIVLTVVLTMMLIRTLGQAAKGQASPQDVLLLMGHAALANLPLILALSLFVAVVLTLGRMYRSSEMVVWFSSGAPLRRFIRPVASVAAPVIILVAVLALWGWPWVNLQTIQLRERFQQRSDVSRVAPGTFQTSADGQRVFFIDHDKADLTVASNVFILAQVKNGESMTTALRGTIETVGDDRFITLEKGQRNETNTVTGERTVARFDTYRVLIDAPQVRPSGLLPPKAVDTASLWRDRQPAHDGEMAWRIGLVLAAANLTLLGIGIAHVNLRRMSNWNLLFALLSFIVYFNLLSLSKVWVGSQRLGLAPALVGLHGGVLLVALALLWWRDHAAAVLSWPLTRHRAAP
jgi:lipopolysaccharide export system permease protein